MKASFLQKYPFIKLNDLNPDASSADEIEAIKANKGNNGPQNPDVIDVAFKFGEDGGRSRRFSLKFGKVCFLDC